MTALKTKTENDLSRGTLTHTVHCTVRHENIYCVKNFR